MATGGVSKLTHTHRRPDIQGLRAFAVGLVVLDHLFGQPLGGFIGVDVFYVLSGFLITGLLLREHGRTGWISFSEFYVRRVKRIIPAAALVLLVTCIAGYMVWYHPRADQTLVDSIAALFFVENWHLIRVGADYLQATGPVSPVQHYWSLSVEEQFYVVWPGLILALLAIGAKMRNSSWLLPTVISTIVALSFAWAMITSFQDPTFAYFDTFSRVWELGIGALLAVIGVKLRAVGPRRGTVLAWAGFVLLIASAFIVTPELPFPGPWALLPVVATVLIIVGGSNTRYIMVLDNPVARYLGDISFSLYLWHFPVIIFTETLVPDPGPATYALMVAIMLALSVLSYHFVENPARNSKWLVPSVPRLVRKGWQIAGAMAVAAALVGLSSWQLAGPTYVADGTAARDAFLSPGSSNVSTAQQRSNDELAHEIEAALQAKQWPELVPALADLGSKYQAPQMDTKTGCRNSVTDGLTPLRCTAGPDNATKTVLVLGDSVAASWSPGIEKAFAGSDWKVVTETYAACPLALTPLATTEGSEEWSEGCAAAQQQMLSAVTELDADLVVVSSAQSSLGNLASGATGRAAVLEWESAIRTAADLISAEGADVVIVGNPPAGKSPAECAGRFSEPVDCVTKISNDWHDKRDAEAAAAAAAGASYIDVASWFCNADDRCPLFIGSTPVRFDGGHLTEAFSAQTGEPLRLALANYLTSAQ